MLTSNWSKALEPNITEWLHEGFSQHADAVPEIFNVNSSSSGIIRIHDSFDPAAIPTSSEGATSPELSLQKGYESVTAPQIFKGKIPITEEYQSRVMYDDIKNASAGLGRAAIRTLNRFAYGQIFILGLK